MTTSFIRSSATVAASLLFALAGCGGDSATDAGPDSGTDGGRIDMGTVDMGDVDTGTVDMGDVDMGTPDAGPMQTHSGLVSASDVQVYDFPELGHGGKISISFSPLGTPAPVTVVDHRGVLGDGCVGVLYHASDVAAANAGVDEGAVDITGSTATIPTCHFVTGRGYVCIGASGSGDTTVTTGGSLPAGTALYTVAGHTFTAAEVGRYFQISGDAVNPLNNGAFPIVAQMGAAGVVVANLAATAVTTPFTGAFATVAGVGPVPGGPDFLAATDTVTVTLTPGGGMDFPAFTSDAIPAVDVFTLLTTGTNVASLDAVPTDGSAFAQGCDSTAGTCGGLITAIAIDTTDGPVTGLPGYVMPAATATGMVAQVRCAGFSPTVTVPADVMALVMTAAPTRVQTTVLRDQLYQTPDLNKTNVIVGRGWVGFTTP